MSDFTNYAEEQLLTYVLTGSTSHAVFSTGWYVGLHTGDPGEDGTNNEVSTSVWTNYTRALIDRTTGAWSTAASEGGGGMRMANASTVSFGTASLSSDIVVSHVTVRNATSSTGGNVWFQGDLSTSKTIQNGDPVTFPTTSLGISFR